MRYVVRSAAPDVNRLMDAVFGDTRQVTARTPAADVWEEDARYVMEVDLPGHNQDSIDVRVEENLLTIASKRREEENGHKEDAAGERSYVLRERRTNDFIRSFSLPKDVDTNAIEARVHNGVLTLTIGKAEQARPRSIEVKSE
ncbi:MAG: Hsp20/alpha crystallin family protein [Spirochaetota bacterium]